MDVLEYWIDVGRELVQASDEKAEGIHRQVDVTDQQTGLETDNDKSSGFPDLQTVNTQRQGQLSGHGASVSRTTGDHLSGAGAGGTFQVTQPLTVRTRSINTEERLESMGEGGILHTKDSMGGGCEHVNQHFSGEGRKHGGGPFKT